MNRKISQGTAGKNIFKDDAEKDSRGTNTLGEAKDFSKKDSNNKKILAQQNISVTRATLAIHNRR